MHDCVGEPSPFHLVTWGTMKVGAGVTLVVFFAMMMTMMIMLLLLLLLLLMMMVAMMMMIASVIIFSLNDSCNTCDTAAVAKC
jgi:uncharacterized membrane protein